MHEKKDTWVKQNDFKELIQLPIPLKRRETYSKGALRLEMLGYEGGDIWIGFDSTDNVFIQNLIKRMRLHKYEMSYYELSDVHTAMMQFSSGEEVEPYLNLVSSVINNERIIRALINKMIYLYHPDFDNLVEKKAYEVLTQMALSSKVSYVKWFIASLLDEAKQLALALDVYGDIPEKSSYYKLANVKIEQLLNLYEEQVLLNQDELHNNLEAKFLTSLRQANPEQQGLVDNRFAELCGKAFSPQIKMVRTDEMTLLHLARHINDLNKRIDELEQANKKNEETIIVSNASITFFNQGNDVSEPHTLKYN